MIKFGTDGWRALVADTYTFENVERVARATAQYLKARYGDEDLSIVVGHDTRFEGRAFTERAVAAMASLGIRCVIGEGFTPTPAISWAAQALGHHAGIVITASHNPPAYNGFKIKADFGGPAAPEEIEKVEQELERLDDRFTLRPFDDLMADGLIEEEDLTAAYLDALREGIDLGKIKDAGFHIVHDAMYGAALGLFSRLMGPEQVVEVRSTWNPGFMGQPPEPIERNLGGLAERVRAEGAAAGIANDGDGDRIGMYDEKGRFVDSHQLMALLVKYLHERRGLSGKVVKTFSTTHMLDKMGARYGLEVVTTPIGFKYIGPKIVEGGVLVGGEESGGMAIKGHIPERDGVYIGLVILEMMADRGKPLSELVQELFGEFGPHATARVDLHLTDAQKQSALKRLAEEPIAEVAGQAVTDVETLDGYKHRTDAGWVLVRPSGTEPVLRIYSEAETEEQAHAFIHGVIDALGLEASAH